MADKAEILSTLGANQELEAFDPTDPAMRMDQRFPQRSLVNLPHQTLLPDLDQPKIFAKPPQGGFGGGRGLVFKAQPLQHKQAVGSGDLPQFLKALWVRQLAGKHTGDNGTVLYTKSIDPLKKPITLLPAQEDDSDKEKVPQQSKDKKHQDNFSDVFD